ncbi:MAG: hypothetical protein OQK12_00495, partial [Motiliproteus sp.]|nr:hypothetical protein [Motiliproteus sp.]
QETQVRYLGDKQQQPGFDQDFRDTERYLQALNTLHPLLQQAVQSQSALLADNQAEPLLINLPGIRRTLLFNNWQPEWGSIEAFQTWISSGDPQSPPENLRVPARLYLGNQP